jgi:hypothetical protein
MNKTLLTALIFATLSPSAFAISNRTLAERCLEAGRDKLAQQAESFGCNVDLDTVAVNEIDNRWYTPSKYVWFEAESDCENPLTVLVQYSRRQCF